MTPGGPLRLRLGIWLKMQRPVCGLRGHRRVIRLTTFNRQIRIASLVRPTDATAVSVAISSRGPRAHNAPIQRPVKKASPIGSEAGIGNFGADYASCRHPLLQDLFLPAGPPLLL